MRAMHDDANWSGRSGRAFHVHGSRHTRLWLLILAIAISAGLAASAYADITYVYDPAGRLVAVVDGSGNAASYAYDKAGNLTGITPNAATGVHVYALTPNNDLVGKTITVYGDGFSSTPSQDTVTFTGTAATATPTSATQTSLVVVVPSTATTGPVSVTAPNGTGTGPTFTVTHS